MTRKLINRLSQLFKEKNNNDSSISRKSQDSAYFPETTIKEEEEEEQQQEISEKQTNKENKASLKREKSLSKRASLWLTGKRKKKNCNKQDIPFRVCTEEQKQQEEEEVESSAELSGKVEIPFDLVIPISYSSFSMSQPLSSSSSSSAFSYSHLVTKSHSLPSDQETIATVRTSIDRQEKASTSNHHHHHLQQFEYEPRSKKLDLAEKVRSMLGDAISLADQELENES